MVIHDICEMIRRIAIRLHEHEILLGLLLPIRPVDGVLEIGLPEATRVEANDVRLTGCSTLVRLVAGDGATGPRVRRRLAGIMEGALLSLKVLGRAEATVGGAVVQEGFGVLVVYIQPL
jgi:hypothetical protein